MLLKRSPGKTAFQQERCGKDVEVPWCKRTDKEERKTEEATVRAQKRILATRWSPWG